MSHTARCALDPAHTHEALGHGEHDHSHVLVDRSIVSSRAGGRVVAVSLAILSVTAILQATIYVATGSIALLADLVLGLIITGLILHTTWESWRTVSTGHGRYH